MPASLSLAEHPASGWRSLEPVYVARMVLFLASDDAAMCTANNYMVEAGSI
jgi:hypothetical protein